MNREKEIPERELPTAKGDWVAAAFGAAIADIRHELLAGWFGRGFETRPLGGSPADTRESPLSQRFGWDTPGEYPHEPGREPHPRGHDLDR